MSEVSAGVGHCIVPIRNPSSLRKRPSVRWTYHSESRCTRRSNYSRYSNDLRFHLSHSPVLPGPGCSSPIPRARHSTLSPGPTSPQEVFVGLTVEEEPETLIVLFAKW